MLVSFSVSNFRSFDQEETFSLVASKKFADSHPLHLVKIPNTDEHVLRTAVLYGANGAGKSNLFRALAYFVAIASETRKKNAGTGRDAFRFGVNGSNPSVFDLQFIVEDSLYRLGFAVDDDKVTEEWLSKKVGNREKTIYERETDSKGNVLVHADGLDTSNSKLKALITVGGPQNQSFLATVFATLEETDVTDEINAIRTWLRKGLTLIAPDDNPAPIGHMLANNEEFLQFASEFLKGASTGIDHLDVKKTEISEDELRSFFPEKMAARMIEDVNEAGTAVFGSGEGIEFLLEKSDKPKIFSISVEAAHEVTNGQPVSLELSEESDGTKRLLNLIPALHILNNKSATFFIDEIDRSLHPMLVWKFLDYFLKSCSTEKSQIILTTHESNLLDLSLLRRDEIWFAEKDLSGATRLYSLSDFKVRNDLRIQKHYLQGRFGAVPYLGNLDNLKLPSES